MPQLPAPKIQNNFPDCVALKLHFEAVEKQEASSTLSKLLPSRLVSKFINSNSQSSTPPDIDLSLTINFSGEQEMEVSAGKLLGFPGGKVTFGIRRGQLQLTLNGCKMPLETRALNQPLQVSIEVETQTEQGTELQIGASVGATLGDQPGATGAGTGGFKAGSKSVKKMTRQVWQVKQTGSEAKPAWIFTSHREQEALEGALTQTKLGTLQPSSVPCQVTATFKVRGEDIQLTWGKIGLTQNIARNKLAVIERALALKYIGPQLESAPLSEVRWHYD